MPEEVTTIDDAVLYLVNKIRTVLYQTGSTIETVIVMVDRKPPPVKRMIEHKRRYGKKDIYSSKPGKGPYLSADGSAMRPNPWISFAGNYKLLQRELYPRLFNAFMIGKLLVPRPGQSIILHGFPGYSEWVPVFSQNTYNIGTRDSGEVEQVHIWNYETELPLTKEEEKKDPNLYNRVYVIENVSPCMEWPQGFINRKEWKEARNDIREADGSAFFYDHWFQNREILIICNDGDIFSYGLLYTEERVTAGNSFRNNHIGCIPYKKKTDTEFFAPGEAPTMEYIDFNHLYILIKQDPSMLASNVQNPILTTCFLLIMAGSDFFQDYMAGIGAETVIWDTFFSSMSMFAYLVQSRLGLTASTRTPRSIVMDEECFRLFVHYCYLAKHGKSARKALRQAPDSTALTVPQLKVHCSNGEKAKKDQAYLFPERNTIRLWGRQVLWNLLYFKNAPFGSEHSPDPFETWDGLPYFPYVVNPATGKGEMTTVVSAKQKPIDEVYLQHMYRSKKKKVAPIVVAAAASESVMARKKKIIASFAK
jgi:hypothetical protein